MNDNTLQPVPFHEDTVFIIEHEREPFVPVKPICDNMGIDWKSQYAKLTSKKDRWGMVLLTIPSEGGNQETTCLPLRKFSAWIYSINPVKVAPHLKETIEQYQDECDGVLFDYWFKGSAINPRTVAADIPAGMMLVSVLEQIGLYKKLDALQEEAKAVLRQRLADEVGKPRKRKWFTPEEDALAMDLFAQGLNPRQIGEKINRPTNSVKTAIRRVQGLR